MMLQKAGIPEVNGRLDDLLNLFGFDLGRGWG